jgi:ribosomal protein S18 acetylase RimI-like enzyme
MTAMTSVAGIQIDALTPERVLEASRMLARAFATNPLHIAAFGSSPLDRNEKFFRAGLAVTKGPTFVANEGSQVLGLAHWVHSSQCQLSALEKLQIMPVMIGAFGIRSALKVSSWLSTWSKHDPDEPHVHLGPIGVAPEAQGRGIGQRLMAHYCGAVDRTGEAGYLETDRPENVRFYERFGFATTQEVLVLGVPNFFMRRPPTERSRPTEMY